MKIREVKEFFVDKEKTPCPLTERLVKAGFQQKNGGYIEIARKQGLEVDYRKVKPSQYWHLMNYCEMVDEEKTFGKNVVCGELVFWMAEVSGAVRKDELEKLVDEILKGDVNDRKKWNGVIRKTCFDEILELISNKKNYN